MMKNILSKMTNISFLEKEKASTIQIWKMASIGWFLRSDWTKLIGRGIG